jgi:putative selenate reductase molybdopterin-binding subunit
MQISIILNGKPTVLEATPTERLLDLLRRQGLISVRDGCDGEGSCGACAIQLDGRQVNSCMLLAAQADGHSIDTVERLGSHTHLDPIQSAFIDAGIVQCGYCTPAMVLAIKELLDRVPDPSEAEVKDALSGTFCRCTGYQQVFGAVKLAVQRRTQPDKKAGLAPSFRPELRLVGKAAGKVDGPYLARGGRAFVDDFVEPGSCVLKMLRSPHAHAIVKRVEVTKALAHPGVVFIGTKDNCPDIYYGQAGQGFPEPSPYDRKMFGDKVLHVGDRVAAVVAETEQAALEAMALIEVEYEVLTPVLSIEDARAPGAPIVHDGEISYVVGAPPDLDNAKATPAGGKIIYQFPIHGDPHRNLAASVSGGIGDLEQGFSEAEVILEREYYGGRVQCTPVEPHVVYTRIEEDRLVIRASTQVPWHVRRIVARLLGLPENKIRVIKARTGGAFGSKQDMVLEEVAAWCTWVTGRPVHFRFSREEEFIASRTRHPMRVKVKLGAKRDGQLTAVYMDLHANTGPYGSHCLTVPMNACSKALPLLLCDHMGFDVHTWYSNIPPTGAYQGYGAPKGSFALQLACAEMAAELGLDLLAFLEKNRVREGAMLEILRCLGEGREGVPQLVYSCGLGPALERGAELIGWGQPVEQSEDHIKIGRGVAIVQQGSGLPGLDSANAWVTQFADGTFMLHSGGTDLGTGLDTVTAKMVAEILELPLAAVSVTAADTDTTPFDVGAYASSGTYFSGGAAQDAARKMKAMLLDVAAEILVEPPENLRLEYPCTVVGMSGRVSSEDIARYTQTGTGRGQLTAVGKFITDKGSFPYGAHFAEVAVDTRTGRVEIRKFYALQDCGTPINPELALGQIYGGVLKTIGSAMFEEMVLDQHGRCLNPNLLDYKVPMINDLPGDFRCELVYTDDPFGPFGSKSIAEISCNGAAPAIASAIHDAAGIWMREWPFTPEKVLRALGSLEE